MESLEFKKLVVAFGSDLNDIGGDLYEAFASELIKEETSAAVVAAEAKQRDYESILSRLEELGEGQKRSHFEAKFKEDMDLDKERIAAVRKRMSQSGD